MTVVQVLRKARALIRKGWTQGTGARTKSGKGVDSMARSAVRFCCLGAIWRFDHGAVTDSVRCLSRAINGKSIEWDSEHLDVVERFNDNPARKKAEVLALFDRAIHSSTKGAK